MACNTSTYNLGVRNIILGKDRPQKFCVTAKADVAGSLNNKYFVIHEPVSQDKHVFYFNVDAFGTDPAVPNSTSHAIAFASGVSSSAVASAVASVIDGLAWISATADGAHIECEMSDNGYAYEARNALDKTKSPSFKIDITQFGSVQTDLGATNGDTTFTIAEQTKPITSPQTGDFVLAEIRRGATIGCAFELKDTSKDSIRRALNFYGSTVVTDDAESAVISGYGSSNLFKSTSDVADQLILRPTDLAAESDSSEDFTIHKCKLKLGELTMSAENELLLPIECTGYLDTTKSGFANLFSYGDAGSLPEA